MKMRVESIHKTSQRKVSRQGRARSKTPFEMFLEDDGPYSRKLYGPVTPKTPRNIQRSEEISGFVNKGPVCKEKIVYTSFLGQKSYKFEKVGHYFLFTRILYVSLFFLEVSN